MNAPLVPEPSSRETTVIGPSALPPAGSVISVLVSAAELAASVCAPVAAAVVSAGLLPPHADRLAIVIPIANTIANVFFIIRVLLFSLFIHSFQLLACLLWFPEFSFFSLNHNCIVKFECKIKKRGYVKYM